MGEPRRWYEVTRLAAGDRATIRIFGEIGQSWWNDDAVSAAQFAKDLDDVGNVSTLDLHLNSPGGDAFDGITIMNSLRDHPARVVVHVDGLAASAASIIAMAGDEVVMGRGAQLMIHDAATWAGGFASDLRKVAEDLDHLSNSMADVYAEHAGGTAAEWRTVMQAETWFNGQEAVEAGLADSVTAREGDAAASDEEVAAMLRRSPVAASYKFKGRANAPAPHTPARPARATTRGGSVELTDEDFAALREKLGLPDDAQVADVLDALDGRDGAAEKPAEEPVAAKLPDGIVAIDKDTLDQLRTDAAMGRDARLKQQREDVVARVEAAVRAGKVMPSRRDAWVTNLLSRDGAAYSEALDKLEPVFSTTESGHDDGTTETAPISLAAVREDPAYKNWKVN
jgi:ATP-dependent protease ClpP protease subunit